MTSQAHESASDLVSTGIEGLDDILDGGLTPYNLCLLEGDSGTGKTTLALQFLLAGEKGGRKGMYVSLAETKEELLAVARSHGWDLEGISITELTTSEESLVPDDENTIFHPSEIELGETTKLMLREVEQTKPNLVVLDSLSEMRLLAQHPLRYRRQILALKQFFTGRQCTVLLLDDRTLENPDVQLHSICSAVISLERQSPDYGVMQRRLQVLKMRAKTFRAGYHDYIIVRGGLQVFPRLVASEHQEDFTPAQMKSGVAELDALMGGGLDKGTSTLLIGPAGSGKSALATQYAVAAAARGERAALFLFDESPKTLLARSAALGLDVPGRLQSGRLSMRQVNPGELSPGEFVHSVRREVRENGATVVVIDSLNGYLNAMPDVRFLSLQLHELLTYLGQLGVTTILVVAQHGLIGVAAEAPIDAGYLADSVIVLRYFESAGRVRQAISVMKRRSGFHERTVRELQFGKGGIVVGKPLEEFQGILGGVPVYVGQAALSKQTTDKRV